MQEVISAVLYVYLYMASWDLEDDSAYIVYFTHMDYFITLLFVLLWDKTVLTVTVTFGFPFAGIVQGARSTQIWLFEM